MKLRTAAILLLLLILSLVIIVPVLAFTPFGHTVLSTFSPTPTPTPKPILTVKGTPPAITSPIAYLIDAQTGNVLVDKQGHKRVPMASTTKIMTALLVIEKADLKQVVTIKQEAVDAVKAYNGSTAQLVAGDKISVKELLYALMLPSGGDAAHTLAETVAGSVPDFVKMMNDYAHRLGLKETHFMNPDGRPHPEHHSSAADMVKIAHRALADPLYAQIVQLQQYILPPTAEHHGYTWENTNLLLSFYAGATGVKTGFTEEAGYCLVFSAINREQRLIGAVMQNKDENERFRDARKLLDWSFALPLLPPPTPTAVS